jgi:hypothetical protein
MNFQKIDIALLNKAAQVNELMSAIGLIRTAAQQPSSKVVENFLSGAFPTSDPVAVWEHCSVRQRRDLLIDYVDFEVMHDPSATSQKIPVLETILSDRAMKVAFEVAGKRWPNVKLGYVGTDRKTFQHYFQEFGNPNPFILG